MLTEIYKKELIEKFIKQKILAKEEFDIEEIETYIEENVDTLDLSIPQFSADTYKVEAAEESSAEKFNNTFQGIEQDLNILYKELLDLGATSTILNDKWKTNLNGLEQSVITLEKLVSSTYDLIQKRKSIFHYEDDFLNHDLIDFNHTTAFCDLKSQEMTLLPTSSERIYLDDIDEQADIKFNVLSKTNLISRIDSIDSKLVNVVEQRETYWATKLSMSANSPVTAELWIKLGDSPVELNKIFLSLLDSTKTSSVQVTPLYSIDNFNYFQLPTNTYTRSLKSFGVFHFQTVEAQYLKLLLTKTSSDYIQDQSFIFEFGFKQIELFNEVFDTTTSQELITQVLSVTDVVTEEVKPFTRLSLEVCERVETNTTIDYSVAYLEASGIDVDSDTIWSPISPLTREEYTNPTSFNFNNLLEYEVSGEISARDLDTETFTISGYEYSTHYNLVQYNAVSGEITAEMLENTTPRYAPINENTSILNYQISVESPSIGIYDPVYNSKLQIFRNIGDKGLDSEVATSYVRNVQRGWKFEEPYYSCYIYISNADGMTLNAGSQPVIIDNKSYIGQISSRVLTGKTAETSGIHSIKVHKSNWLYIPRPLGTLADLRLNDSLYPYNHKYLIEGYEYNAAWSANEEKIYVGADIFAETVMKEVSIYDLNSKIADYMYEYYALDKDTNALEKENRIIVLKINPGFADYRNEKFMIKWTGIGDMDNLLKYLRLKVVFSTEDETIAPSLESYKIILE
jgi:hypothetical protein